MNSAGAEAGRRGRVWRLAAVAAAVLAGCSGEDIAERVVEEQIERESGGDVDIDLDDGAVRVETDEGVVEMNTDEDGNISIEGPEGQMSIDSEDGVTVIESDDGTATIEQGAGVPDDFPASVPLPEGFEPEFSQSTSSGGVDGWILGGAMDGDMAAIGDAYFAALEAAGFERQSLLETPESLIFAYADGEHMVNGMIGLDGDAPYVNLTVATEQ